MRRMEATSFERELAELRRLTPPSAQIVFVSGNFNILHPGHVRLLRFAKECGDFLVVGVQDDVLAGRAAILDENLRIEGVRCNSWVDHAFLLRRPAAEFIRALKPAVVVKGKEHESSVNAEQDAVNSYGGRLVFGSGETVFSSLELLRRDMQPPAGPRIRLPQEYNERHGFTLWDIRDLIDRFSRTRMVVVGDLIVDDYIDCDPIGMSQEDPTVVVTPILQESFVGGAGIVAAHAASLGARIDYFSVVGSDAIGETARERLQDYGVVTHLLKDDSRPTTLKQRYRAQSKTLLRVSHLRQHSLSGELQAAMIEQLRPVLASADVVVFADFNYGCLPQPLVDAITRMAMDFGVLMVADSQCSSQVGDVSRFRGMMMLTPTEREARISTHNHEDGLVVLAERLRRQARAKNLLLKLGAEGVFVHAELSETNEWRTDQLPAFSASARDTAGAGDSLLAASALTLAAGGSVWQAAFVGSLAAAAQVERIGNVPLQPGELLAGLAGEFETV